MPEKLKPIETAPKDGTNILAFDNYHTYVVWWLNDLNGGAWILQGQTNFYSQRIKKYPTHWLPLPEV